MSQFATPLIAFSEAQSVVREPPTGPLKGWDFLVDEVVKSGVERQIAERYFSDPQMPERGFIPFAAAPRETQELYQGMLKKNRITEARDCLQKYKALLDRIAQRSHVPARVIASIMYVETGCGKFMGSNPILPRLARLSGLSAPDNVQWNYERLLGLGEKVTHEQIRERAEYLKETFLEQVPALLSLSERTKMNAFDFKGSSAGAFGIPQFLPLSLIRYGTDGDGDHRINISTIPDAAASIATYLEMNGWKKNLTYKQKMAVLFTYNRSEPYGQTVLRIAERL